MDELRATAQSSAPPTGNWPGEQYGFRLPSSPASSWIHIFEDGEAQHPVLTEVIEDGPTAAPFEARRVSGAENVQTDS